MIYQKLEPSNESRPGYKLVLFYSSNGVAEANKRAFEMLKKYGNSIKRGTGLQIFTFDVKQRNALEISSKYDIHAFPTIAVIKRGTNDRSNTLSQLCNGFTKYNLQNILEKAGYKIELVNEQTEGGNKK